MMFTWGLWGLVVHVVLVVIAALLVGFSSGNGSIAKADRGCAIITATIVPELVILVMGACYLATLGEAWGAKKK